MQPVAHLPWLFLAIFPEKRGLCNGLPIAGALAFTYHPALLCPNLGCRDWDWTGQELWNEFKDVTGCTAPRGTDTSTSHSPGL